jgi:hypothetical protein
MEGCPKWKNSFLNGIIALFCTYFTGSYSYWYSYAEKESGVPKPEKKSDTLRPHWLIHIP